MITTVTASRRLVAALAAFMILAPVAPSGVFAAPGIAPGEAVTVASDSSALLRVEPGYGAEVVSEVAPGTWTSIVSGPYYDTEGLEWFEVDAGGFLPSSVLAYESTDSGYIDSAQEVSSEAVAEDASYEAPAEIAYEDPAAVEIELDDRGRKAVLNVHVGPGDMGRVIGKRGRVAQSIRTVVRAAAARDGGDVEVEFLD